MSYAPLALCPIVPLRNRARAFSRLQRLVPRELTVGEMRYMPRVGWTIVPAAVEERDTRQGIRPTPLSAQVVLAAVARRPGRRLHVAVPTDYGFDRFTLRRTFGSFGGWMVCACGTADRVPPRVEVLDAHTCAAVAARLRALGARRGWSTTGARMVVAGALIALTGTPAYLAGAPAGLAEALARLTGAPAGLGGAPAPAPSASTPSATPDQSMTESHVPRDGVSDLPDLPEAERSLVHPVRASGAAGPQDALGALVEAWNGINTRIPGSAVRRIYLSAVAWRMEVEFPNAGWPTADVAALLGHGVQVEARLDAESALLSISGRVEPTSKHPSETPGAAEVYRALAAIPVRVESIDLRGETLRLALRGNAHATAVAAVTAMAWHSVRWESGATARDWQSLLTMEVGQ